MSKYDQLKAKLIEYMSIEAMSRYEEPVVEKLKANIKSQNFDFSRDGFGSLIITKKSKVANAPKVMIAAHMDEVGFLVRNIEDNGNLLVHLLAESDQQQLLAQKLKLSQIEIIKKQLVFLDTHQFTF